MFRCVLQCGAAVRTISNATSRWTHMDVRGLTKCEVVRLKLDESSPGKSPMKPREGEIILLVGGGIWNLIRLIYR